MNEVEHVLDVSNELGEGPLWHPDEAALYWVDILTKQIHRLEPEGSQHRVYEMPMQITALGLAYSGGLVVASRLGFAYFDPKSGELQPIIEVLNGQETLRFNDGAVDPLGCFWAGTMNELDHSALDGTLFKLHSDGKVTEIESGFTICNGIGWSPDGQSMYFTDTRRRTIYAYDHDLRSGEVSNRREFVVVPEDAGVPDGLTVDAEGFIWSAHYHGWRITRYDPDGKIERVIRMPVKNITSCAFGGPELNELYVTTAWSGLTNEERVAQPLAGDLFRLRTAVKGQMEYEFTG